MSAASASAAGDLAISLDGPSNATAGTDITYTSTVRNVGDTDLPDATFTDSLDANVTFVGGTVPIGWSCTDPGVGNNGTVSCTRSSTFAAGASATIAITVHVRPTTPNGTFVTDSPTVSTSDFDEGDENNFTALGTLIGSPTDADLSAEVSVPEGATAGSTVPATLTLRNNGPATASGATITFTLPADATFVAVTPVSGTPLTCTTPSVGSGGTVSCSATLPNGAASVVRVDVRIPNGTVSGTPYDFMATASSSNNDPLSENDTGFAQVTVAAADLVATLTGTAAVDAGQNITYLLTLTNNGPDALPTELDDVLPAGTLFASLTQTGGPVPTTRRVPPVGVNAPVSLNWNSLASGSTATFTLVVTVRPSQPTGTITDTASAATSPVADPTPANNSASASTAVTGLATPAAGSPGGTGGPPLITSLSQPSGAPGAVIGITGLNLDQATQVRFGSTLALFQIDASDHITVLVPSLPAGPVDVTVVSASGTSPAASFTIEAAPTSGAPGGTGPAPAPAAKVLCASMPDLKRHTLKGAKGILARRGCDDVAIHTKGSEPGAIITNQTPKAGSAIFTGKRITLTLQVPKRHKAKSSSA